MAEFADLLGCCEAERRLLYAAYSGRQLDFSGGKSDADRTLRGGFLRRLLREKGGFGAEGLRVVGARITERLDLTDMGTDAAPLPPLSFERCNFEQEIDLGHAHLARLSLAGSVFSKLNLRNVRISGPLDLTDVHAGDFPTCWVDARDCRIEGGLDASGARLAARTPPADRPHYTEMEYALWLRNARIEGSLYLSQGFVAIGGVHLAAAHVRGTVWARGARLVGSWDYAFHLQNVRIGANLVMDQDKDDGPPFDAQGTIWMMGARIEGIVQLDDATIDAGGGVDRQTWHRVEQALQAESIEVGTDLRLVRARIRGRTTLASSRIRGSLDLSHAVFAATAGAAFDAAAIQVGGNALLEHVHSHGLIDLQGATIGGSLRLFRARLTCGGQARTRIALCVVNATIGQDVLFHLPGEEPAGPGDGVPMETGNPLEGEAAFVARGTLDFTGAQISGDLRIAAARLFDVSSQPKSAALRAQRVRVGGSVYLRAGTIVEGEVDLSGAVIGKSLKFGAARLAGRDQAAIYARDVEVGCDLNLVDLRVCGDIVLARAEIGGKLEWNRVDIGLSGAAEPCRRSARIDLQHLRVGAVLIARHLRFHAPGHIDLGAARVGVLQSRWPDGWSGAAGQAPADGTGPPDCPINFDGLSYERIEFMSEHVSDRHKGDVLIGWLERQDVHRHGMRTTFFPQPYRQLARTLRAQGDESVARRIAVAEQDRRFQVWGRRLELGLHRLTGALYKPLYRLYGLLFGYGLEPARAFVTLFLYALVGMAGVMVAQYEGILVERPAPVATSIASPPSTSPRKTMLSRWLGPPAYVHGPPIVTVATTTAEATTTKATTTAEATRTKSTTTEPTTTEEAECTDAAATPWDDLSYAVDMILPFIPLHEEEKCEIMPRAGRGLMEWRAARDVYVILGWLISSLTLLTASGFLRKSDDPGLS